MIYSESMSSDSAGWNVVSTPVGPKETGGIINEILVYTIADIKLPKVIEVYRD